MGDGGWGMGDGGWGMGDGGWGIRHGATVLFRPGPAWPVTRTRPGPTSGASPHGPVPSPDWRRRSASGSRGAGGRGQVAHNPAVPDWRRHTGRAHLPEPRTPNPEPRTPMPAVAALPRPTTTAAEEAYLGVVERVLATGVRKANRTGTDTIASFAEHYSRRPGRGLPAADDQEGRRSARCYARSCGTSPATTTCATCASTPRSGTPGPTTTAASRPPTAASGAAFPSPTAGAPRWAARSGRTRAIPERRASKPTGRSRSTRLGYVLDTLAPRPDEPALVVSAWHPANAAVSRLPPCHYTFCFNVAPAADGGRTCCTATSRSARPIWRWASRSTWPATRS